MSQFFVSSVSSTPQVPTSFVTDNGTVIPAGNVVNVNGGSGVQVIANPNGSNNMVINLTEIAPGYVQVTGVFGGTTYTVGATDYFISCDTTGGVVTIKLPNVPTSSRQFIVKDRTGNAAANNIIITTVGGAVTIDGNTSYTFTDAYESLEMLFNGSTYESF